MPDFRFNRVIEFALRKLLTSAAAQARRRIKSSTLRASMTVQIVPPFGYLFIPQYWAIYVHDGRGPVYPRRAVWLVWFTNPQDDPRIAGGYPVRASDIRRLTKAQWKDGLRKNRERFAAGQEPFMVVTKAAGPTRPIPFFNNIKPPDDINDQVARFLAAEILVSVPPTTETASIRLR